MPTTKCPRCGKRGHWSRDCPLWTRNPDRQDGGQHPTTASARDFQPTPTPRDNQVVKCYICNEKGHFSFQCPQKTSLYCGVIHNVAQTRVRTLAQFGTQVRVLLHPRRRGECEGPPTRQTDWLHGTDKFTR